MSPVYHPAGEDGPNAMMAQAEEERRRDRMARVREKREPWRDPVRPGWPGPTSEWTEEMRRVFDEAFHLARVRGHREPGAFAAAYGAVVKMPEGRS